MNSKRVSVLLRGLCSELLYTLLLLVDILLYNKFSRTVCWDFMTGRDSCVNKGRHVFGALELIGQVGRQPRSLNWYIFSEHKIKRTWIITLLRAKQQRGASAARYSTLFDGNQSKQSCIVNASRRSCHAVDAAEYPSPAQPRCTSDAGTL
jgi:hypothetical protein